MKVVLLSVFSLVALMFMGVASADDIAAGESLFNGKGCIGCHGPAGKSNNPSTFPALAGQDAGYLDKQLKAFRDYSRRNPMMNPMASGLSDEQIRQLAAYLSQQSS